MHWVLISIAVWFVLHCLWIVRRRRKLWDRHALAVGMPRSGRWPAIEKHFLALHPKCEACGGSEEVVPHHKRPFHLHPELELDPENLIALCNKHTCHLAFGHNYDWKAFVNPHVARDAAFQRRRVELRKYE